MLTLPDTVANSYVQRHGQDGRSTLVLLRGTRCLASSFATLMLRRKPLQDAGCEHKGLG